jgi:DNA-binding FadR family transcriptional regulator
MSGFAVRADLAGPGVARADPGRRHQRTLAEHRAILDALSSHDPVVARSWSTVHIASVQQWLASVL